MVSELAAGKTSAHSAGAASSKRSAGLSRVLNSSRWLGLIMLSPALVLVVLFFLIPVVMTAVFAFTNMSTATGISGGAYQIAPGSLQLLQTSMPELAAKLAEPKYIVDEDGLAALKERGIAEELIEELREHLGEVFGDRREAERMIKALESRPSTRVVKQISEAFNRSVVNLRFATLSELLETTE